ncbi:MAG: M48 family metallopeptidase [Bacillota bacterium]
MLGTLYFLTTLALVFENALDFQSLRHYKKDYNRIRCLRRLVRRHTIMAAFFTWGAWLMTIITHTQLIGLLGGWLAVLVVSEFWFERNILTTLKTITGTVLLAGLVGMSVFLFYRVLSPMLLVGLVIVTLPLFVLVFDRSHGWFLRRFARVVPYFHRMDDADYLAGLSFSERAYMIDLKAQGNLKNAMIVGLFNPRSLYVSKSMLAGMSHAMVEGIVAHEVGHIRLHHIQKRLLLAFFFLMALVLYGVWVFSMPSDSHTLYTVLLTGWFLIGFSARFLLALTLQHQEYEADRYAKAVGKADALADALRKLKRQENEQGHPARALLHETHPPIERRIERLTHTASK